MTSLVRLGGEVNDRILGAHTVARERGDTHADIPHMLVSILEHPSALIRSSLHERGHDADAISAHIRAALPPPPRSSVHGEATGGGSIQVTAAFMALVDTSKELAEMTGHREVGELHLLRALLRSQDPLVQTVFGPDPEVPRRNLHLAGSLAILADHGRVLTDEAAEGKLDPVVGREREIERVIHILGRRRKNNPVLLGEPGVGKTAIVEGLAQSIVDGRVPRSILGRHIFALDIGSLVAGTKYRGEFESRIQELLEALRSSDGKIMLFIDEMHLIARAGGAEGAINAAGFLKPMLARGELRVIGATTISDYRDYVMGDGALERRFQPVHVREPSVDEAVAMLRGLRPRYESHHGLTIADKAIVAAVVDSDGRIPHRHLPDKAIDLVDEAASHVRSMADLDPGEAATELEVRPEHIRAVLDAWMGEEDETWHRAV